jgi:hypothetical protein
VGLREDREDLDRLVRDVIEHPYLANAQPELGFPEPPEPLDPALALLSRLMPEVSFERIIGWRALPNKRLHLTVPREVSGGGSLVAIKVAVDRSSAAGCPDR